MLHWTVLSGCGPDLTTGRTGDARWDSAVVVREGTIRKQRYMAAGGSVDGAHLQCSAGSTEDDAPVRRHIH